MKTIEIELDGKKFIVNELTFGQVEELHVLLGSYETGDIRGYWNYQVNVISVALLPTYPDMKPEKIRSMRIGSADAAKAVTRSIMLFSGLIKETQPGEPQPGEAQE